MQFWLWSRQLSSTQHSLTQWHTQAESVAYRLISCITGVRRRSTVKTHKERGPVRKLTRVALRSCVAAISLVSTCIAVADTEPPAPCTSCQGTGVSVTRHAIQGLEVIVAYTAKPSAKPAAGGPMLHLAKYRMHADMRMNPGVFQPVAEVTGPVVGVGLAVTRLDIGDSDDLLLFWGEADGQLRYRIALSDTDGAPSTWGDTVTLPDQNSVEGLNGVGADVCDIDGDEIPDIVVGWSDGERAYYRIAYHHGPQAADRWGPVLAVPGVELNSVRGVGIACVNVDEDYSPELVFSWIDDANIWNQHIGRNLNASGETTEWLPSLATQSVPGSRVAGGGLYAGRFDGIAKMDWVMAWVDAESPKVALVNNPQLIPAYIPTQDDYQTIDDEHTGLSRAAVMVQKSAGIQSPGMLINHIERFVANATHSDDVLAGIKHGLGTIQPPLPEAVLPELTDYLYRHFVQR